jgi:hypothetical protein
MKVRLYFHPVDIDVDYPLEAGEAVDPTALETYINENWAELVDPSLPRIQAIVRLGELDVPGSHPAKKV